MWGPTHLADVMINLAGCAEFVGGRAYAAPEVFRALWVKGQDPSDMTYAEIETYYHSLKTDSLITPAVDVWSAGCMIYRLLTAEDPLRPDVLPPHDSDSDSDTSQSASSSHSDSDSDTSESASSSYSETAKELHGNLAGEDKRGDVDDEVHSMHQRHLAWVCFCL